MAGLAIHEKKNIDVEIARINFKQAIIVAAISALSGFAIAFLTSKHSAPLASIEQPWLEIRKIEFLVSILTEEDMENHVEFL